MEALKWQTSHSKDYAKNFTVGQMIEHILILKLMCYLRPLSMMIKLSKTHHQYARHKISSVDVQKA